MFLSSTNFESGKYKISQNSYTTDDLTTYISKYESRYLIKLLGSDLYDLFIDSLISNIPTNVYLTLYSAFHADNLNSSMVWFPIGGGKPDYSDATNCNLPKIIISEGILEMLKGFIFFEYTRDQSIKNTIAGNVQEDNENSKAVSQLQAGIKEKYNEAVSTYQAIQWYISQHMDDYPDFNGVSISEIPDYA
jgi:hypothetical protein